MTFIGELVSTPYGTGKVLDIRGVHTVIEPLTWRMDRDQKPTFFINSTDAAPLYKVGDLVSTVYGDGRIESIRENDAVYVILLDHWKLAQGQSPTLYLQGQSLSRRVSKSLKGLSVATKVITPYGNGVITSIREADNIVVVCPDNWIMADGKPPRFFMNPSHVTVHKDTGNDNSQKSDMVESSVEAKIKRCIELKNNGSSFFKRKDFENAKIMYTNALTVLQYIGDNLTNEEKASVMEQSVPCHNNMALCSLKLHKWADCEVYAKNAIMLISALESQIPLGSKVWECLKKRKITLDTLLKKWKKRSFYLQGKGYSGSLDLKRAKECFKSALDLIEGDEMYVKEENELKKLIMDTTKKIVKENKIEKKMWSKAFAGDETKSPSPSPNNKSTSVSKSTEEDIDLKEFGLPSVKSPNSNGDKSAVSKKVSRSSLLFGGAALFTALGLIFGFSFFRFRKN